ncbi:MAG: fibronectin type III-like domain-contianing protein [Candidatus Hodarchaeota archaeon]
MKKTGDVIHDKLRAETDLSRHYLFYRGKSTGFNSLYDSRGKDFSDDPYSVEVPLYSLKDFKRLNISAGESLQITFENDKEMLKLINEKGERILEPREFLITIGGSPSKRSIELGDSPTIIQRIEVR